MTTVRADQLGPQHLAHLIRVPTDTGPRDLYLSGHRPCTHCGAVTVYSPGHRQAYELAADALVEVLADVRGRR